MPVLISTPESPWATQQISFDGIVYTLDYSFNTRDEAWRLSVSLDAEPIISGVKIMPDQDLFKNKVLESFDHGTIACFRFKDDGNPIGADNLGVDKAYSLVYLSNQDIIDIAAGA